MADLHVAITGRRGDVHVMSAGSHIIRTARTTGVSTSPQGAEASFTHAQGCDLIDALARATGHYPTHPDIDAQRDRIREAAEELRQIRQDARQDPDTAALAELALSRHVGHQLADAAAMIYACRDHMADYTVAKMVAEVIGMLDVIAYSTDVTNPEDRIQAHMRTIRQLAEQLPRPGDPSPAETPSGN